MSFWLIRTSLCEEWCVQFWSCFGRDANRLASNRQETSEWATISGVLGNAISVKQKKVEKHNGHTVEREISSQRSITSCSACYQMSSGGAQNPAIHERNCWDIGTGWNAQIQEYQILNFIVLASSSPNTSWRWKQHKKYNKNKQLKILLNMINIQKP
jgi:hypothetical protein